MAHVIVLGGDGYLGWPTAMHLSNAGFDVTVADNYFRRNAMAGLDVAMLYDVPTLVQRASLWHELTGKEIKVFIGDLAEPRVMQDLISGEVSCDWCVTKESFGLPDAVVHYAEQPSAPYSVMDLDHADFTIVNNLRVTNNLMFSVKQFSKDTHIVKLGTMGEYGTPNIDIEEGWIEIEHKGRQGKFLFPRQASSIYHTTKIMDTDLLWFGVRTWGLRVTDLMQGPVYGLETEESVADARLRPFFNYDEVFGTVINRFMTQAVCGYPLTVYGAGGQTRGYINIRDTLQCVRLSIENPPETGDLRIFNQITETFSVNELAEKVKEAGSEIGLDVAVESLPNPRKEMEEHYYNPTYQGLKEIGVEPNLMSTETLVTMLKAVQEHKANIRTETIFRGVKWA